MRATEGFIPFYFPPHTQYCSSMPDRPWCVYLVELLYYNNPQYMFLILWKLTSSIYIIQINTDSFTSTIFAHTHQTSRRSRPHNLQHESCVYVSSFHHPVGLAVRNRYSPSPHFFIRESWCILELLPLPLSFNTTTLELDHMDSRGTTHTKDYCGISEAY